MTFSNETAETALVIGSTEATGTAPHRADLADSVRQTVLVVDDDPLFRTLCHATLAERYDVVVASDGHEAVQLATQDPPAMIVLDLQMPGWDGEKVLRAVRADAAFEQTAVLILTSDPSDDVLNAMAAAGADSIMNKMQFSRESLLTEVGHLRPSKKRGPRRTVRRVVPVM